MTFFGKGGTTAYVTDFCANKNRNEAKSVPTWQSRIVLIQCTNGIISCAFLFSLVQICAFAVFRCQGLCIILTAIIYFVGEKMLQEINTTVYNENQKVFYINIRHINDAISDTKGKSIIFASCDFLLKPKFR